MRAVLAIVALLGLTLAASATRADVPVVRDPPQWRDAQALSQPRSHLNAVALPTGEILVVGGLDPASEDPVLRTAEILDPRTGAVSRLPHRPAPRIDSSATTLPSGLLVLAGGSEYVGDEWRQTGVTEVFDPWTKGLWRARSLRDPRADHGAVALDDGRVLVAGGHDGPHMLASVEIFEPLYERWVLGPSLPRPRQQFTMAKLPGGRVLVAGGLEGNGVPSRTSLVYDPWRNVWDEGPELSVERVLHATVTLPSGDVMLVGGQRAAGGSAERYDFRRQTFAYAGTFARARMLPLAAALADGTVVVIGGVERFAGTFFPTPSVEVYDPATNAWTAGPDPSVSSAFSGIVALDGDVWVIAGAGEEERALARVARIEFQ